MKDRKTGRSKAEKKGPRVREGHSPPSEQTEFGQESGSKRAVKNPKVLVDSQGSLLEGEIEQAKLHGQGKMTLKSGEVREGQFFRGSLRGKGTRVFPDGRVMTGQFVDNELNGRGQITDREGNYTRGEFTNSVLDGQGESKWFAEKMESQAMKFPTIKIKKGTFKNGKLEGEGAAYTYIHYKSKHPEEPVHYRVERLDGLGDELRFIVKERKGQFVKGKLTGRGFHKQLGLSMEGEFLNGKLHGKGELTRFRRSESQTTNGAKLNQFFEEQFYRTNYSNREEKLTFRRSLEGVDSINHSPEVVLSGHFQNGKLVTGIIRNQTKRFEGEFIDEKLHGKGKANLGSLLLEGAWENGVLKKGKVTVLGTFDGGVCLGEGRWNMRHVPTKGDHLKALKIGTVFSGVFDDISTLSGTGSMFIPDFGTYEGAFSYGMMEGKVALTKRSGSREFGRYFRTENKLNVESRIDRNGVHSVVED